MTQDIIRQLTDEYYSLSEEEYNHYEQVGAIAAALHRDGETSFVDSSTSEATAKRKRARIQQESSQAVQLFIDTVLAGSGSTPENIGVWADGRLDDMALTRSLARKLRMDRAVGRQTALQISAEIFEKKLVETETGKILLTKRMLQGINTCKWSWHPHSPHSQALLSTFEPDCVASCQTQLPQKTLAEDWAKRHVGLQRQHWQLPAPRRQKPFLSACLKQGCCTCTGEGRWCNRVKSNLMVAFRNLTSDNRDFQSMLLDGVVLLQFHCKDTLSPPETTETPETSPPCYVLHLSFLSLRPWYPVLTMVEPTHGENLRPFVDMVVPVAHAARNMIPTVGFKAQVTNEGAPKFFSIWSFAKEYLDFAKSWHVRLWTAQRRDRPVESVTNCVYAIPHESMAFIVWSPEMMRQRRRRRSALLEELVRPEPLLPRDHDQSDDDDDAMGAEDQEAEGEAVEEVGMDEVSHVASSDEEIGELDAEMLELYHAILAEEAEEATRQDAGNLDADQDDSSSDSSSSSDNPRPPRAPQAEGSQRAPQQREDVLVVKDDEGNRCGGIYHHALQLSLYARCELHERCVRTRTYKQGNQPGSGHPLGFLAAWCRASRQHDDKAHHMKHNPSHADRVAARRNLMKEWNAEEFANLEASDCEGEPEQVPAR